MDHKDDIMVTVKNKAGQRMRVPIQYAQRAINSGTEEITEPVDVEFAKKLLDEYMEHLKRQNQNT